MFPACSAVRLLPLRSPGKAAEVAEKATAVDGEKSRAEGGGVADVYCAE
jgi:hypothetical protein